MQINKKQQKEHFEIPSSHFCEQLLLKREYYQQIEMDQMKNILSLPRGANLVDFGSGVGRITFFFLQQGYNVCSVDISRYALTFLQEKYKREKTKTWGKLTVSEQLPTNNRYDAIVGADVLHHVPIYQTLPLFRKSLRPNGKITFSEPNAIHIPWYVHFAMRRIPFNIESGILQCTEPNFRRALQKSGFMNVNISGHGLIPTKLLTFSPSLCIWNAYHAANIPGIRLFAYRFIISATSPN